MSYINAMKFRAVTVVETPEFERTARGLLSDAEYDGLIEYVAYDPICGDLILGTGGVRKLRWRAKGKGKSGGVRVIYYYYNDDAPIFMLTLYAKSGKDDLSAQEKKALKSIVGSIKDLYSKRRKK